MRKRFDRQPDKKKGPQILTRWIVCDEVRLLEGEDSRVLPRAEAEQMAEDAGLDLVVVTMGSSPLVVRMTDFGRYKFEAEKKAREAKKKQHTVSVKEIKMGIRIDNHDYEVKKNRAIKFLEAGNKIKCTIRLRGREVQHKDLAFDLGKRFVADLSDHGTLEGVIRMESHRMMTLNVNPGQQVPQPKPAAPQAARLEIKRTPPPAAPAKPAFKPRPAAAPAAKKPEAKTPATEVIEKPSETE